jgi:hypothetical protein
MTTEKLAQGKDCGSAGGPSGRNSEGPNPEERPHINKGGKPLIFVDACIAISMTRAASGAKGAEERFKRLFDLLSEKAGKKEVIVPYGATHDEIAGTESKAKNAEFMFRMSKGAKWRYPNSIKALERARAFEAFLKSEDPAYGTEDVLDGEADPHWFINWKNTSEAIDARNKEKTKWADDLNELKSSGTESDDYEMALFKEQTYEIVMLNRLIEKKKRNEPFDDRDERFLEKEVIPLAAGDLSNIETWFTLLGFSVAHSSKGCRGSTPNPGLRNGEM